LGLDWDGYLAALLLALALIGCSKPKATAPPDFNSTALPAFKNAPPVIPKQARACIIGPDGKPVCFEWASKVEVEERIRQGRKRFPMTRVWMEEK